MDEKLLEKVWGYVEKVISPYQFWLITLILTGALSFLPSELLEKLSLEHIASSYRGWLVIVFLTATLVILFKGISLLIGAFVSSEKVNSSNLNDEEKALLFFFIKNQFQEVNLNTNHPSVIGLINRKFITRACSPVYFDRPSNLNFEAFIITVAGRKKLSSHDLQHSILSELKEDKVLTFVNSISKSPYYNYEPQKLR